MQWRISEYNIDKLAIIEKDKKLKRERVERVQLFKLTIATITKRRIKINTNKNLKKEINNKKWEKY